METARAARAGRRKNLSLRPPARGAKRQHETFDAAYESFYRKHVAEIYQYALAVLGNPTDAEDVTQQTFLNAYRAFQRGERPRKAHNWLIKIAHNVCRMRWRQASRRPQEVPLEHVREPVALDDEKPSLDEVLTALARLPFNQRAAIVMREVEDRSYAEIAEVLETTVPAVEALLFRARTNLRARRKALAGALGVVPVPASISTFFGGAGGGGLIAAGGALVGSELALKVAAVVASGVVAGGLGYKTVGAIATAAAPATAAAKPDQQHGHFSPSSVRGLEQAASRVDVAKFRHPRLGRREALLLAPTNDQPSATGLNQPAGGNVGSVVPSPLPSSSPVTSPLTSPLAPPSPSPSTAPASDTVEKVVTTAPAAAPVPAVPAVPAAPPTPVPVSPPAVPVAVNVPALPLPPVLK